MVKVLKYYLLLLRDRIMKMSQSVIPSIYEWVKLGKEPGNEWMWNIFNILLFFRIDKFFLISFPILFFIFNIIYWLAFIL